MTTMVIERSATVAGLKPVTKERVAFVGMFALVFASRVLLSQAFPADRFRNYDEILALQATQAPLLGLPPIFLGWPGGPLRMLFPAVLGADFLLHGQGLSPNSFIRYLGEVDRSPWSALSSMRWLVMFISSLGICSLIVPIARRTKSLAAGIVMVTLLASVPVLWQRSMMVVPDALAISFLCLACAVALLDLPRPQGPIAAGLLLGVGAATKITTLQAAPFVALLALQRVERKGSSLIALASSTALGFAATCPHGLADPVRFAKSVLGNIAIKSAQGNASMAPGWRALAQIVERTAQLVPWWLLVVTVIAVGLALFARRWWELAAFSCGFLASLFLVIRSAAFNTHYLLPLAVVVTVFSALILGPFLAAMESAPRRTRLGVIAVSGTLSMLAIGMGGRTVRADDEWCLDYYRGYFEALAELKRLEPGARVIISPFLLTLAAGSASSDSLVRIADDIESGLVGGMAVRGWLQRRLALSEGPASALANNFTEVERNTATYLRLGAGLERRRGADLYLVATQVDFDSTAARFKAMSRAQAFEWLKTGRADALIIDDMEQKSDLPPGGRAFGAPGTLRYVIFNAEPIM